MCATCETAGDVLTDYTLLALLGYAMEHAKLLLAWESRSVQSLCCTDRST